jgi:2-iminobutanoate/2-iminopropanoate deaminase
MKIIHTPHAPAAIGPYVQAIQAGDFLFCSGQTPLNPATMKIEATTIEEQTEVVLQNLQTVIEAAGYKINRVVKTSVFLKNFADFERMNKTYEAFFAGHKPARTTVEVSRLPKDALVEIECVVYVK